MHIGMGTDYRRQAAYDEACCGCRSEPLNTTDIFSLHLHSSPPKSQAPKRPIQLLTLIWNRHLAGASPAMTSLSQSPR